MIKFSLEMLWSERRKVYGLCTSVVMTLSICLLFLQFLINPNLTQKITSIDILQFSETFCIALFGLFILAVCVSLICYSCNYYMKLHAREIGMIKMAGFSQGKIILYQLIQMITIMVVSVMITCCLSLVTTPIFLTIVYRYCHIHQSVFYFSTRLFSMIGILVACILVVLIAMQINYINNNSLSSLIKDKYITTQKEDHRVFIIPDYIYILGYFLGLYAMYVGEELDAGFAIASCIGAISAYGLFYYFIPHTLNEMVDSLNLKGEDTIVLGDLALFMQQSKLLIVFIMLAIILIPTFIFSSIHMKMLHIALHIGAVLINFVLCLSVVSRFDIDALEKKEHFKNLCKMGLTNQDVKKISYKEGNGFYIVLWIFAGIYILSIACTFLIRASIDLGIVGIVLLEFVVPYGMAEVIVYLKKVYNPYSAHPKVALNGLNFDVEKGDFICIMGASGSGKTTLVNILSTIDEATHGQILLNQKDLLLLSEKEKANLRKEEIGFIFQNYNLIESLTIKNNILFSLRLNKVEQKIQLEKLNELTKMLNIEEIIDKYPSQCSGGQQQRAAIARALINEPKIIFADEPTGNLDSLNARELMEYFVKINEGKYTTIIMVTHDSFVASYSKKVYYMKDGHLDLSIDRNTKSQDDYYKEIVRVITQMHI